MKSSSSHRSNVRCPINLIALTMAVGTVQACLPIPHTERLTPALAGTLRTSDGTPAQGVSLILAVGGTCATPEARTSTDSLGRFAFPEVRQHYSWLFMGDAWWSYRLCAFDGDSATTIYHWSEMHVPPRTQALTCTVRRQQLAHAVCSEGQ